MGSTRAPLGRRRRGALGLRRPVQRGVQGALHGDDRGHAAARRQGGRQVALHVEEGRGAAQADRRRRERPRAVHAARARDQRERRRLRVHGALRRRAVPVPGPGGLREDDRLLAAERPVDLGRAVLRRGHGLPQHLRARRRRGPHQDGHRRHQHDARRLRVLRHVREVRRGARRAGRAVRRRAVPARARLRQVAGDAPQRDPRRRDPEHRRLRRAHAARQGQAGLRGLRHRRPEPALALLARRRALHAAAPRRDARGVHGRRAAAHGRLRADGGQGAPVPRRHRA
mmetsp:Transcript_15284/g.53027  ORF Transcript_15284/g.53027 Transcript_15284/m.53027 type:complete len:285 (-) Transcript_15284:108-962(-)